MSDPPEFAAFDFTTNELGIAVPRSAQSDRFEREYAGTWTTTASEVPEPTMDGIRRAADEMRSFFDTQHPAQADAVGSWANVPLATREEGGAELVRQLREPSMFRLRPGTPPFAVVSLEAEERTRRAVEQAREERYRAEQRHPTRAHFFVCRVHADCRAHEGVGRACWLASGRTWGDALGMREKARLAASPASSRSIAGAGARSTCAARAVTSAGSTATTPGGRQNRKRRGPDGQRAQLCLPCPLRDLPLYSAHPSAANLPALWLRVVRAQRRVDRVHRDAPDR